MNKTTLLIALTFTFFKSNAAVFTVCNLANSGTQFSQIDPAIAGASNGDTIYVMGSSNTYTNCTIDKNIKLIGPGTFAQKDNALPASVSLITIASNLNGVSVLGFKCTIKANSNSQNIEIGYNYMLGSNCLEFYSISNISNLHVYSNTFISSNYSAEFAGCTGLNNVLFENNIFSGAGIKDINGTNVLFNHNVFYNYTNAFSNVSNITFNNNIFYNSNPTLSYTNCTFNDNITYSSSTTYPALPSGNGNIDNTDPMMINVANTGGYLPTQNFSLQAGSPAINAGNDGTNMGITGGSNVNTVTGEVYNMPVIRKMNIQNTSVPQNGNVNVKVRSTIPRVN